MKRLLIALASIILAWFAATFVVVLVFGLLGVRLSNYGAGLLISLVTIVFAILLYRWVERRFLERDHESA